MSSTVTVSVDLALTGVALGAVASLAGLGVLVTYRTTGVFNLASGGIAMFTAYLVWQATRVWHWPLAVSAVLAIGVIAPLLGWLAERLVFRSLRQREASGAETLVASLGVLVLLIGIAYEIWGLQSHLDAPSIVPSGSVDLPGGATIDRISLAQLAVAILVVIALTVLTRLTRIGRVVRAVVDSRDLARGNGIRADRVAASGWMVGSALAGLTGVLLAPASQLDPYSLTLVVLEILAVVVIARLSSPVGVVAAALALGIGQAELQQVQLTGRMQSLIGSLHANLFVVALLLGLLLVPRLAQTRSGSVLAVVGRPPRWRPGAIPAGLLLASPLIMAAGQRHTAEQVPGLALVFVSLVLLSGVAGQISLGAAGYAGLGAVLAAAFADPHGGVAGLPRPLAVLLAAVLTALIGLITGYPALRRTGLALALTTLAVGTVASRFVFEQPYVSDLSFHRAVTGDRGYYAFEAACLLAGIGIVHVLTSGPLGRALRAARDNADGARAAGVDVRSLTLLAFAVSAGIAGLGGALLTGAAGAFDAESFDPLHGLLWFTAVIVAGADSIVAAVVAAAAMTTIDAFAGSGASLFVVGLLATLLGRLPGGVSGSLHRLRELRWAGVREVAGGLRERLTILPPVSPVRPGAARLSAAGRRLLRPEVR